MAKKASYMKAYRIRKAAAKPTPEETAAEAGNIMLSLSKGKKTDVEQAVYRREDMKAVLHAMAEEQRKSDKPIYGYDINQQLAIREANRSVVRAWTQARNNDIEAVSAATAKYRAEKEKNLTAWNAKVDELAKRINPEKNDNNK